MGGQGGAAIAANSAIIVNRDLRRGGAKVRDGVPFGGPLGIDEMLCMIGAPKGDGSCPAAEAGNKVLREVLQIVDLRIYRGIIHAGRIEPAA